MVAEVLGLDAAAVPRLALGGVAEGVDVRAGVVEAAMSSVITRMGAPSASGRPAGASIRPVRGIASAASTFSERRRQPRPSSSGT
ncbi:hypothetical protein GCM10022214_00460 [Actinomadura miaoliensis]|uniref:Uncharacterized protein n=1 Tax=Actinomadura miaoliensis TaxID=430685 RepID=A0ABP7UVM2_9ACTN